MDRYELRALERDANIQESFEKSGKPDNYWQNPEVIEHEAVTATLRAASKTYTPPEGDTK